MAPVRRYLRITKYSVLECRIYLDSPALAQSWLLHPRHQTLARVMEAIRPLVLPKLREEKERERAKKKPSKKSRVKDVIVKGTFGPLATKQRPFRLVGKVKANTCWQLADDFEVSMFLTETSTRHSLLSKKKHFREKGPSLMQSNTTKLISETNDQPVDVDDADFAPIHIEEESGDEEDIDLSAIPTADIQGGAKRDRDFTADASDFGDADADNGAIEVDSGDEEPPSKRRREIHRLNSDEDAEDDKKKMAMDVSYEGFAIYGRVLCLVVKRRDAGAKNKQSALAGGNAATGQAKMENWITSTQMPADEA
ncbi:hypothetical protein CCM_00048 [Cordyceps militaris CM01]|uniref:Uncharacterized protein n=1 Tax=Cordyceps militaris (strain CM01) TaxID=983644 RepID=G3J6R6_CORMM|nr:uncharacterized protein CCM_00048 [Cordyceps militaris CM01]EGX95394.1 hypothetical protein CCM_00048 [Cordyceps militaris CM01]